MLVKAPRWRERTGKRGESSGGNSNSHDRTAERRLPCGTKVEVMHSTHGYIRCECDVKSWQVEFGKKPGRRLEMWSCRSRFSCCFVGGRLIGPVVSIPRAGLVVTSEHCKASTHPLWAEFGLLRRGSSAVALRTSTRGLSANYCAQSRPQIAAYIDAHATLLN